LRVVLPPVWTRLHARGAFGRALARTRGGTAGMSFWLGTLFFILLELVFLAWVQFRRTEEKVLKHTLYGTAVFCCYIAWAMVYASQIHTAIFTSPVPKTASG